MKAFVLVKARVGEISQVVKRLRTIDGVTEVDGTFGSWDAVAVVEAEELMHLGSIVFDEIQATAGVESTMTLPVVYG
jgi:DNA-binding Lrp family transcriptional regulator